MRSGRRRRAGHGWRRAARAVKVAVVVQRYGTAINGGAELHARYIAEHLARHAEVEVLTTCATDYVTWRNELPPGVEQVNGVPVRRFPREARARSARVRPPVGTRLRRSATRSATSSTGSTPKGRPARRSSTTSRGTPATTTTSCSSATATTTRITARARPPIARDSRADRRARRGDRPVDLPAAVPRRPRADVQLARRARDDPGTSPATTTCPASSSASAPTCRRTRSRRGSGRSTTSAGRSRSTSAGSTRTRAARSCSSSSRATSRDRARQAVARARSATRCCRFREHPRIRHLGFLDDADKFDAMAAADLLIMPSYFESLSMVALEAWALGTPVLANGQCDVLKGQCIRSNAGLYYDNATASSSETLQAIEQNRWLSGDARPQRPPVLPRALRLAGHRAEVPRHVRAAARREPAADAG